MYYLILLSDSLPSYLPLGSSREFAAVKDDIDEAKADFKDEYVNYQQSTIAKQYYALKNAGVDTGYSTVTDYIQAVKKGEAGAEYDSFQDYNSKQNGGVVEDATNATVNGLVSAKNYMEDAEDKSTKKGYGDAKGNRYYKNDDGSYTVYDSKGNLLSKNVKSDNVEASFKYGVENTHTGSWKQIEERLQLQPGQHYNTKTNEEKIIPFRNGHEVAWTSDDGTYWVKKGSTYDHYNENDTVIGIGYSEEQFRGVKYEDQTGHTLSEFNNAYLKTKKDTKEDKKEQVQNMKDIGDAYINDLKNGTNTAKDVKNKQQKEKDDYKKYLKDLGTVKDENNSNASLLEDYSSGLLQQRQKDRESVAKDEEKAAKEIETAVKELEKTASANHRKPSNKQLENIYNEVLSKYNANVSEENVLTIVAQSMAADTAAEYKEESKNKKNKNKKSKTDAKQSKTKDKKDKDSEESTDATTKETKKTNKSKKQTSKNNTKQKEETDATVEFKTPRKRTFKDTVTEVTNSITKFLGSSKKPWTDGNGLTYKPNGDGTYNVLNNNGDVIGMNISGTVVAAKVEQNEVTSGTDPSKHSKKFKSVKKKRESLVNDTVSTFKEGNDAQSKVNENAKSDIEKHASEISEAGTTEDKTGKTADLESGKVLYAADLSYYVKSGSTWDRYNALGDKVKTGISDDEIQKKLKANMLHAGDKPSTTVADDAITKIICCNLALNAWNKLVLSTSSKAKKL